ncbi:hypothetical protein [Massilia sp. 9I]|uniref:hypothetical protein n=1 Tax=Massilia sp. 9I TaxID=2653152 RepID=UPI0012F2FCA0|nr:hypothetical protein [Massilia sp. 9I]VXC71312.1 conserved exported hypothetical protein [Massilia sp. 9I]
MKASRYLFCLVTLFHILFTSQAANAGEILPKEICKEVGVPVCDVKGVDAFSAVDLNGDGKKEIIFAYDGGSCGEQHYVFMKQDMKWVQIANWCGMEGGAYKVLRTKHNGHFDIDTYVGKLCFNGKTYSKK